MRCKRLIRTGHDPASRPISNTLMSLLLILAIAWPGAAIAASFQWLDAKHRLHSLAEYRGQPVILHLWASWCPPCRAELPTLDAWHQAHPGTMVLPVSVDESAAAATTFLHDQHIDLPLLLSDTEEAATLGIRDLPATLLVDAQGKIRLRLVGMQPWDNPKFSAAILGEIASYMPLRAKR